jgi:hypothetical protein
MDSKRCPFVNFQNCKRQECALYDGEGEECSLVQTREIFRIDVVIERLDWIHEMLGGTDYDD